MRIKALVIAPYTGMVETTTQLQEALDSFDITVVLGDLDGVIPHIATYEQQQYDVILSRGGTARLLREYTSLPVIEIKVSSYDVMRILTLVKDYKAKIEIIGFSNVITGVATVLAITEAEVTYREVHSEQEAALAIAAAKQSGVKVIVGDTITVKKAKEVGLQGVLITSGRESILEAFEQAQVLCQHMMHNRHRISEYQTWLEVAGTGVATFDNEGRLVEGSPYFYYLLTFTKYSVTAQGTKQIVDSFGHLTQLMSNQGESNEVDQLSILLTFDKQQYYRVRWHRATAVGVDQMAIIVTEATAGAEDIVIHYAKDYVASYPALIVDSLQFEQIRLSISERMTSSNKLFLCGEAGSGHILLAATGLTKEQYVVKVEVKRESERSLQLLTTMVHQATANTVLIWQDIERIDFSEPLKRAVEQTSARIVFCSEHAPARFYERGILPAAIFNEVKEAVIYIPPIRDHEQLEEYIRTYLVTFNEQFGKQIVGIRHEVMQALLRYQWAGNLDELSEMMKRLVQQESGEYIERATLLSLGLDLDRNNRLATSSVIDLTQSLQDIEQQIIRIVLEEEGMSQTKAAARLGINRTTLWRKMRENN